MRWSSVVIAPRRFVPVALSLFGVVVLAALFSWAVAEPRFWFPTAYKAQDRVEVVDAKVSSLESDVHRLQAQLAYARGRERKRIVYDRAVWGFCKDFRSTQGRNNSNYTTLVLQTLAIACDRTGVPTSAGSYP